MVAGSWTDSSLRGVTAMGDTSESPSMTPTSQHHGTMEGNQHAFAPAVPVTQPLGTPLAAGTIGPSQITETSPTQTGDQAKLISKDGGGGSHPNTVH